MADDSMMSDLMGTVKKVRRRKAVRKAVRKATRRKRVVKRRVRKAVRKAVVEGNAFAVLSGVVSVRASARRCVAGNASVASPGALSASGSGGRSASSSSVAAVSWRSVADPTSTIFLRATSTRESCSRVRAGSMLPRQGRRESSTRHRGRWPCTSSIWLPEPLSPHLLGRGGAVRRTGFDRESRASRSRTCRGRTRRGRTCRDGARGANPQGGMTMKEAKQKLGIIVYPASGPDAAAAGGRGADLSAVGGGGDRGAEAGASRSQGRGECWRRPRPTPAARGAAVKGAAKGAAVGPSSDPYRAMPAKAPPMEPPAAHWPDARRRGRPPRRTRQRAEKKAEAENKAKKDKLKTAMGTVSRGQGLHSEVSAAAQRRHRNPPEMTRAGTRWRPGSRSVRATTAWRWASAPAGAPRTPAGR